MLGTKSVPHFQRYRLPRFTTDGFEDTLVEFKLPNSKEILIGSPINFSKNGLAFEMRSHPKYLLDRYKQIDYLRFVAYGQTFFEGPVEIKHCRLLEGRYQVGVFTLDRAIVVQHVLGSQLGYQIINGQNGFKGAPQEIKISEEFQLLVTQFRDYLSSIKEALEKTTKEIALHSQEEQETIALSVLKSLENSFREKSDTYLGRISEICHSFQDNELFVYKEYFQKQLHDFILLSPFVRRCVDKPLGYSGDYEIMNMIYGNHFRGESLFAKLQNRYWCTIAPSRANIDRLNYFYRKIEQTIKENIQKQKKVRITTLGAGPAKEILEFIRKNDLSDHCAFTCVDLEPKALAYSQQSLVDQAKKSYRNVQLNFVLANVVSYLRSTPEDFMYEQDLIYASGLFDYLKQSVAQKLTKTLFPLLNSSGEMVVVNASATNPGKIGMEFAGEWYLNYRTKEDMSELASGIQEYQKREILLDREQVYWFLSLKK